MVIDCDTCVMRDIACDDCVVSVLLGMPPGGAVLEEEEHLALAVLAGGGLVPPLRLLPHPEQRALDVEDPVGADPTSSPDEPQRPVRRPPARRPRRAAG